MIGILVALGGLVAPGLPHGLMGFPRAMIAWLVAFVVCAIAAAWTPYGVLAGCATMVLGIGHAGWCYHRHRREIVWSWSLPLVSFGVTVAVALGVRVVAWQGYKLPSSSMAPTLVIGDHIVANKLGRGSLERGDVIVYHQPCTSREFVGRVMAIGGDTIEVRCDVVWVNGKALPLDLVDAKATYLEHYEYSVPAEAHRAASYREVVDGRAHLVFEAADREAGPGAYDFPDAEDRTCASNPDRMPDNRPDPNQAAGTIVVAARANAADACAPFRHYVVPQGHLFVMGDNRHNANDSRFWGSVPDASVVGHVAGAWWPPSHAGGVD